MAEQISEYEREQHAARPEVDEYAAYCRAVGARDREADPELLQRLRGAVCERAPADPDHPRLQGWYHTVELGNGLSSTGRFDLRTTVDLHGLPESLKGKTALDVGTCDGFWAFEVERRGADRVVAIDIEHFGDFDWLPQVRASKTPQLLNRRMDKGFWLAHAMRGSRVEHQVCSVYDLSPDTVGTFGRRLLREPAPASLQPPRGAPRYLLRDEREGGDCDPPFGGDRRGRPRQPVALLRAARA